MILYPGELVGLEKLTLYGSVPLSGELYNQGAKNSSLPILGACMLTKGKTTLINCPKLSDVDAACDILSFLGCKVSWEDEALHIDSSALLRNNIPEHMMNRMRSSIIFMGALLARIGFARVCFPGGCDIGQRPIDLHLLGLRKMGVIIEEKYGCLDCHAPNGLRGADISLSFPSVGATENILLAAVTAKGDTIIRNAATEPEIVDLAGFLSSCGAKIYGAGQSVIRIEGVDRLYSTEYKIMPDRITAATYLCAVAVTGGDILLKNVRPFDMAAILPLLEEAGCKISIGKESIYLSSKKPLKAFSTVRTMPYPGFPTDAQPILMAVSAVAQGTGMFIETIFENRFRHVPELNKLGANIRLDGRVAVVEGVSRLFGTRVQATDLRGGAALVIAGLAAEGKTEITDIKYIDRGYYCIEEQISLLGGNINREYDSKMS